MYGPLDEMNTPFFYLFQVRPHPMHSVVRLHGTCAYSLPFLTFSYQTQPSLHPIVVTAPLCFVTVQRETEEQIIFNELHRDNLSRINIARYTVFSSAACLHNGPPSHRTMIPKALRRPHMAIQPPKGRYPLLKLGLGLIQAVCILWEHHEPRLWRPLAPAQRIKVPLAIVQGHPPVARA